MATQTFPSTVTGRVGMLVTPDTGLDAEMWQWCPDRVVPFITRLQIPFTGTEDPLTIDKLFASRDTVQPAVRSLISCPNLPSIDPDIVVFNCTAASHREGLKGEAALRSSMLNAGARRALTASGAVIGALTALGAHKIAVGTPYKYGQNLLLQQFLAEAGFEVPPIPTTTIEPLDDATDDQIRAIAAQVYRRGASVMFISCISLRLRHLLSELSAEYGIPVIGSLQATMWAALAQIGERVEAPDHPLHSLPWPEQLPLLEPKNQTDSDEQETRR